MNSILRQLFTLLFFISSHFLLGQHNTNVNKLAGKKNYHERVAFDSANNFKHELSYSRPGIIDAGFTYTLLFHFTDFATISPGQKFDVARDTALISCSFGVLSAWNWDYDDKASFSGTILVVNKTAKEVVIEEDIIIIDRNSSTIIYKGRKTFVLQKKM